MAGKTVQTPKVNDIVLSWMFDYICYRVWEQFSSNNPVSESDKDVIQGLGGLLSQFEAYPAKDCMRQKFLFMANICRLDDGEDVATHYYPESDETPLESMIPIFTSLVDLQDTDMQDEGKKLVSIIKSEAVMVCCRAGDFDLAKSVLNALWCSDQLENEEKKTKKLLKEMVEQRNKYDKNLKDHPYCNFTNTMKKYLKKIYSKFHKPILLTAAEKRLASDAFTIEKEAHGNRKQTLMEKNLSSDSLNKCQEDTDDGENKRNDDTRKLRKLWNQNTSNLFEAEADEIPSQSTEDSFQIESPVVSLTRLTRNSNAHTSEPQQSTSTDDRQTDKLMPVPPRPVSTRNKRILIGEPRADCPTSTSAEESPRPTTSNKTQQPSVSGDNMTYRKNVGRPNRHEPVPVPKGGKVAKKRNWDEMSMNFSFTSSATIRTKWTEEEMEELFKAVRLIGIGNWVDIKLHLGTSRTNVMLKDKWRNMVNSGDAARLAKTLGKGKEPKKK